MNAQLSIFSFLPDVSAAPALQTPAAEEGDTIEDRFARFNKANPQVYSALREMALTLKDQGIRHYGIAALFEVLRFSRAMQTGGDAYKLNNDYRALYARRLMEEEPELAGFFELRQRRGELETDMEATAA